MHYHAERNHRGLGNAHFESSNDNSELTTRVVRCRRIGGLFNFNHREAA
jgi:hypothetical protein